MLIYILLGWIGYTMNAPIWFWWVFCIAVSLRIIGWGGNLYLKGLKSRK